MNGENSLGKRSTAFATDLRKRINKSTQAQVERERVAKIEADRKRLEYMQSVEGMSKDLIEFFLKLIDSKLPMIADAGVDTYIICIETLDTIFRPKERPQFNFDTIKKGTPISQAVIVIEGGYFPDGYCTIFSIPCNDDTVDVTLVAVGEHCEKLGLTFGIARSSEALEEHRPKESELGCLYTVKISIR